MTSEELNELKGELERERGECRQRERELTELQMKVECERETTEKDAELKYYRALEAE